MKWSSIKPSQQADLRLALSPSQPSSRADISRAFAFLPSPIHHVVDMLFAPAGEVSPVVAWDAHTLGVGPSPSLVPALLGLVIVLGSVSVLVLNAPPRAAGFSLSAPVWLKKPFKHLRRRQHRYGAELLRTYDTYKRSVDDFVNMTRLCRSLQEQLKERDARLLYQNTALDSLTYDVDGFSAQNELLRTSKDKLRSDKARLREQLRDERDQHAKYLREFQQDLEGLLHQVEVLEADKATSQKKYEEAIQRLREDNLTLRRQVLGAKEHEPCDHIPYIEELQQRVAFTENALRHITQENESLKQQLLDQQKIHARQQLLQTQQHTEQQATFVDALEKFKTQLIEQQEQHDILSQKIAKTKADKSKIKAKLKHARTDAEAKSAEAARLHSELCETERLHAEQAESFQQDLHFAYVESHFERQMYKGELSDAHAESTALRQQLADLFNRHKNQATRLDRADDAQSRLRAARAEARVAEHVEDMLAADLRRRNDEYETLEISFDVLEAAYGFLAAELVRTEHALKDALAGRTPRAELRLDLDLDLDDPEDAAPHDEDFTTTSCASSRDDTCTTSASSSSERSWPATPGLVRTPDTTARSPASSPVVATPPLPALLLPRLPARADADACRSPFPASPSDSLFPPSPSDSLFGSWSEDSFPGASD